MHTNDTNDATTPKLSLDEAIKFNESKLRVAERDSNLAYGQWQGAQAVVDTLRKQYPSMLSIGWGTHQRAIAIADDKVTELFAAYKRLSEDARKIERELGHLYTVRLSTLSRLSSH